MAFNIKQNDTGPPLQVILREPSDTPGVPGDPVPLVVGDTVRFHMVSSVSGSAVKVNAAAVIVNPGTGDGRVDYVWAALDTDTVGNFEYEFEITFAAGEVRTVPNARNEQIVIRAQIA